jgi:flagellar motor switch protein FliG
MSATAHAHAHAPEHAPREDINGLMAELASKPQVNKGRRKLSGPERAAVLMLSLGDRAGKIFSMLDDDELREISTVMASLGTIDSGSVEELLLEFVSLMSGSAGILGGYDVAEQLLQKYLPAERVGGIMDEVRGPAGRNMWEKLAHVHEEVLANYLKNEYPQTVAVVLSKLRSENAARVLSILPQDFSSTSSAAC